MVILAPHITKISETHPVIERIGYHYRDYFAKQWPRFKDEHWGVLAHSTHLRGGTYDDENGEQARGQGHPGDRYPRRCSSLGPTWATSIRTRSISRIGLPIQEAPGRSQCRRGSVPPCARENGEA